MSAFSNVTRSISLAALSWGVLGCVQHAPGPPPDAKPARSEASKSATVVEAAPEENPPKLKEALEKARDSVQFYAPMIAPGREGNLARSQRDMRVGEALSSVKLGFVDIPVYTEDTVPNWTKVRLNTAGAGLDVIRFTNAYSFPADLIWAFAIPADTSDSTLRWWITTDRGTGAGDFGFKQYYLKNYLILAGLDLPPRNVVVFQHLEGAQISGGREYLLCFLFEDEKPRDVYVKLMLLNPERGASPNFASAHPIAEKLGLELPFRFSNAATLTDLAADVAGQQGADAGLKYLEQHLAKTGNRAAEFYQAQLAHNYASQLVAKPENREKANPYFLQAAAAMRQLQKKYGQLEPQEQGVLALALYNEACTLAITGQAEKGLESLREAVQAGFKDVAQIRGDDDLQAVRDLPAFSELLKDSEGERSNSPFN